MNTTTLSAEHHAAIIAQLTAAYGRPKTAAVAPVVSIVRDACPAPVAGIENADGSCAAPIVARIVSAPLPVKGTIDARAFIVSMRRAATRDQRIGAIAAYIGYNTCGVYSSQEMAANMKAQQELRGAPKALATPVHTARATVAGFIAGMPDLEARRETDLAARFSLGYALCPTVTEGE